jgi:predicted sulfurtransferase
MTGTHLTPKQFHAALADPSSVVIDVRNFNETLIGKFAPPGTPCSSSSTSATAGESSLSSSSSSNNNNNNNNKINTNNNKKKTPEELLSNEKVLDPLMRRSTEFPEWVEKNRHKLEGKKVLMYCTGGVRCERASAYVRNLGIEDVSQLEGERVIWCDWYP